jgi:glutaminyl-peptide cyclotransferase
LFFDGEEAFKDWTATDSIYGSRDYAKNLKKKYNQDAFDSMELFVLLDLIGSG